MQKLNFISALIIIIAALGTDRALVAANNSNHENKHIHGLSNNCWCDGLSEIINYSKMRLISKYGEEKLDASPTYATSGMLNKLTRRLHKALNGKHIFRMGLYGDSMTLPIYTSNAWFYNVSRWMNAVLSSSSCSLGHKAPVDLINQPWCNYEKLTDASSDCADINISSYTSLPSSFCAAYNLRDMGNTVPLPHHNSHSSSKPLNATCDNITPPTRRCSVYEGSGKYLISSLSAKGGTSTCDVITMLPVKLDPKDMYDMIFWDFGTNDYQDVSDRASCFSSHFVQHVLHHHKNLAAMGVVYWADSMQNFYDNCFKDPKHYYEKNLAEIHYTTLKHLFNPHNGNFRNISLLTMSLSQFCSVAGCYPMDFYNPPTAHASDNGISMFADLIIWHLIKPFQQLINTYCKNSSSSLSANNREMNDRNINSDASTELHDLLLSPTHYHHHGNTGNIHSTFMLNVMNYESLETIGNLSQPWIIDSHMHPEKDLLNAMDIETWSKINSTITTINTDNIEWTVIAALAFETPTLAMPHSINDLAILCAPSVYVSTKDSDNLDRHYNVFAMDDAHLDDPLRWIEFDIMYLRLAKCAGYHHMGTLRHIQRFDDFHYYSAASSMDCPHGGFATSSLPCPMPSWGAPFNGKFTCGAVVCLM
jgi:hypothetical protein